MSFKEWMQELNRICCSKLGLGIYDLPDMCFRDAFDDGVSPQDFFDEDVRANIAGDYGDDMADCLFD